jgi:U3 small nucleolar RNA-associated protein 14
MKGSAADFEDNWWQNTFTNALKGVQKNVVYEGSESSESEESESESDESGSEMDEETSGSEYSDEDEEEFKRIGKKYFKRKD